MDAPLLFKIWGIPFVLAGLYFVFGRFIVEGKRLSRTVYAITNKKFCFSTAENLMCWTEIQSLLHI